MFLTHVESLNTQRQNTHDHRLYAELFTRIDKTVLPYKEETLHHRHFETEELREMLKQNELMDTKAKSCGAFLLVEARKIKPTTPSYISASL